MNLAEPRSLSGNIPLPPAALTATADIRKRTFKGLLQGKFFVFLEEFIKIHHTQVVFDSVDDYAVWTLSGSKWFRRTH